MSFEELSGLPGIAAQDTGGMMLPPATSATPIPVQKSPAEMATRLAEWNKAFETMRSDSAINAGLLKIGTALMQPIPVGQNATGHVGNAVQSGFDTMNAKKTADLNLGMKMEEQSRAARAAELNEVTTADALKTSAATRDRAAVRAPLELQQLEGAVKKLNDELALAKAQERAGLRTPEHLKRISELEIATKQGKIDLDKAHGRAYDATASWNNSRDPSGAAGTKSGKQTLNVKEVELQDGTKQMITTTMVNGRTFVTTVTLPKFGDPEQARKQAEKETSDKEPLFGTKGYQGTRAQEIDRRMKELMTPKREIVDSETGQRIDPKAYDAMGVETPGSGGTGAGNPDAVRAELSSLRLQQREYMKANNGQRSDDLDAQIFEAQQRAAGRAKGSPSTGGYPTGVDAEVAATFVRDANGNVVVNSPGAKPGAPGGKPKLDDPINEMSMAHIKPIPGESPEAFQARMADEAKRKGVDVTQGNKRVQVLKRQILEGRLTKAEAAQALQTLRAFPGVFSPQEVLEIQRRAAQ